jgi:hypothetical protein
MPYVLAAILYLVTLAEIDGSSNAFVTSRPAMLPTNNIKLRGLDGRDHDHGATLRIDSCL